MKQLLFKFNNFCLALSSVLLDNGVGRAPQVQETVGPGETSGFSEFIFRIVSEIGKALLEIGEFLLRCIARLAYFIAKIALNIMDFMNILIQELSGQATDYSISGNSNLFENDILFKFMFNEITIRVLKAVFIFALVMLIIFTIMAIVKQEWQNHITGKQNSVKKVMKKMVLAIFTMLITPIITIVGIVFSNVLLSSGMSALTGQQGPFSFGAHIYSASSYDANRYRAYAVDGKKIPIVFDYDGGFENSKTTTVPPLTEESTSAQESQINNMINSGNFATGQSTYNMFKNEAFYSFSSISDSSSYYTVYDGEYLKTRQIEYYVMADFLDFALSSGAEFYIVNTEKVYESVMNYIVVNDGVPDYMTNPEAYNYVFSVLDNFYAYDENNEQIFNVLVDKANQTKLFDIAKQVVNGDIIIDHIDFKVYYNKTRAETLSTTLTEEGTLNYNSISGSTDEVTGAKYIFTYKMKLGEEGDFIYVPVRLGDEINGMSFTSRFLDPAPLSEDGETPLRSETVFLARGVFTTSGYPTAIREQGSSIVFYRQDPVAPSTFNFSEIFNYQENNGGQSGDSNFVSDTIEFLTGVDVSTLVPDIQVNLNFLNVFSKTELNATNLNGGRFTVNYSFVGSNLKLQNLYDELKINYVVLLFAAGSLFMSFFYIIWGLIQRIFEITLLWATYPGWISKFPIEKDEQIGQGKTAFKGWKDRMIERVMALFSIYLSLALVLLLVPIVFKIDYITTFNIPETNLFGIFNADVANLVIKTAFVLVLFNFLDFSYRQKEMKHYSAPRMIEEILLWSKTDPQSGYLQNIGADTIKEIKKMGNVAVGYFTPKGIINKVKGNALHLARNTVNAIPGSNLAHRFIDNNVLARRFERNNDEMLANSQANLLSQTTESGIDRAAGELSGTTKDHTYMEGYRQAHKDYWRQTGEGLDGDFRKRSSNKGYAKRLEDIAKKGGGTKTKIGKKNKKERKIYKETRRRTGV